MTEKRDVPNRMLAWLKRPKNLFELFATALLLFGSVFVLLYYITGPALGYFHSDCTDSLLWSRVMLETGEVLSEDFAYAAILLCRSRSLSVPHR